MDATDLFAGVRVVPVVVLANAAAAVPVAKALVAGGVKVAEITLRTDEALAGIEAIAKQVPDMLVGVGSVRTHEQMLASRKAGAKFAVSPGATAALLDAAHDLELPFIPGACTPSEMIWLFEHGYSLQKFFPAEQAGGASFLKSVSGPLPELSFMPTGGVTPQNAHDYLSLPNVATIGGSWLTPTSLQETGDFEKISQLAADTKTL